MKQSMQTLTSSNSNEWYTPPEYIFLVDQVFGGIDLDPASSSIANQVVNATEYFSDGGLEKPWWGRVFVNPPYGRSGMQAKFLSRALREYQSGNIRECIILTKTVPGYVWYDEHLHAWENCLCITKDRISFYKPSWVHEGEITYPKNSKSKAASTFWYLGHSKTLFRKVFTTVGMVLDMSEQKIYRYKGE